TWLVTSEGQACGLFEDTRRGKRLIADDGSQLISAHLSYFAFATPAGAPNCCGRRWPLPGSAVFRPYSLPSLNTTQARSRRPSPTSQSSSPQPPFTEQNSKRRVTGTSTPRRFEHEHRRYHGPRRRDPARGRHLSQFVFPRPSKRRDAVGAVPPLT